MSTHRTRDNASKNMISGNWETFLDFDGATDAAEFKRNYFTEIDQKHPHLPRSKFRIPVQPCLKPGDAPRRRLFSAAPS
jgi:hypothetical protein